MEIQANAGSIPGVCLVKDEFLVKGHERSLNSEYVAKEDLERLEGSRDANAEGTKRAKLDRRKLKGQNRDRRRGDAPAWKSRPEFCPELTHNLGEGDTDVKVRCSKGETCRFQHDPAAYLASKPEDISSECYVRSIFGHCPWGISCRFGSGHLTKRGVNLSDESLRQSSVRKSSQATNVLDKETVSKLWKKRYDFERSIKACAALKSKEKLTPGGAVPSSDEPLVECTLPQDESTDGDGLEASGITSDPISDKESDGCDIKDSSSPGQPIDISDGSDSIVVDSSDKKQIDWGGLLYLSPLTTVGNLPFRRICVELGADVTCSEMALGLSLLQGTREWNLVRRHPSERIFGVQICGNNPFTMTKAAQVLEENTSVDFVDINLGCPIDALYQQGCGSGMMARRGILLKTCQAMNSVLRRVPLTVKLRTGVTSSTPLAHQLMPLFRACGVSLATVHGRSREQRYTKHADWSYINRCAQAASPMPVFGNGDILSYEDHNRFLELAPDVSGVMVGRGALIKPWIFTEIKERRHWDISSQERFQLIRNYVNYGLEHWGSDTRGVETTRRFLLEWLSFLYRYVPVGILERPPQGINQRPPVYRGRDDLETLMASPACSDWVKISEMLLGPVPEGFSFLPKHKSNAWK